MKIGQIASQQAEYIPADYCDALAGLRSSVAPMDIATVRAQIEKYLGKPVDELYASFEEKPLGSASIAQVHRATLPDGTVVAVKVRRPGIVDTVARDFTLIEKVLDTFVKLGDLMGTILGGLQEENYKIDPFLTNLSRGIVAVEGTVKTLRPKVNILNFFIDKVNMGLNFNLNLEHPEEMNPDIALKLLQLANGLT